MESLRELHLFAGAGGGILGGILLGHTCVCAVEIEPYCRKVLLQRQRDGIPPKFPIWDDIRTFDAVPWRGFVDVVCSGFPCQRHSTIGNIHGSDHFDGWPDTARTIREADPAYVLLENVPGIRKRYWGDILRDLAEMGYDVRWGVFSCSDASEKAPQIRERIFALAQSRRNRLETAKPELGKRAKAWQPALPSSTNGAAWSQELPKPTIHSLGNGLADYMGESRAIGNGQVPAVVKLAWETLS